MQQAVVEAYPKAKLDILIVWMDVLPLDGQRTAAKTAQILSDDPRIHHFYDPERRVGKTLANSLGWEERFAWDIYLLYPAGAQWKERMPKPQDYVHQLSRRAEDAHFCSGESLAPQIRKMMSGIQGR